ncbi:hypothetical protein FRB90_003395, partial [Tulasnella sp. 427]
PLVPTSASAAPLLRVGRIRILDAETNDFLGYIAKPPKEQRFDITYTPDHDNAVVVQFAPSSSLVTFDLVTAVVQHAVWTVNADCSITAAWPPSPEGN